MSSASASAKPRVLMLDPVAYAEMGPPTRARLDEVFNLTKLWEVENGEAYLASHGAEFGGILARGVLPEATLEKLPNVKIVSQTGVGTDKAPIAYFKAHGISYTNTRGSLSDSVADIAITLGLCVCRGIITGDNRVRTKLWATERPPMGRSFSGKKYGVLGLGSIGQAIAQRLEGFDGEIWLLQPQAGRRCQLRLHADAAGARQLGRFPVHGAARRRHERHCRRKRNCARSARTASSSMSGAVAPSMRRRWCACSRMAALGGAGLDVHAREPHANDKLIGMSNVVLLPHLGSSTVETRAAMHKLCIDNLLAHFEGRPLLTPIYDASKPNG